MGLLMAIVLPWFGLVRGLQPKRQHHSPSIHQEVQEVQQDQENQVDQLYQIHLDYHGDQVAP